MPSVSLRSRAVLVAIPVLVFALVENLQREALSPIEEAEGYLVLADEHSLTQVQIARAVGKDRSTVANALRLQSCEENYDETET